MQGRDINQVGAARLFLTKPPSPNLPSPNHSLLCTAIVSGGSGTCEMSLSKVVFGNVVPVKGKKERKACWRTTKIYYRFYYLLLLCSQGCLQKYMLIVSTVLKLENNYKSKTESVDIAVACRG